MKHASSSWGTLVCLVSFVLTSPINTSMAGPTHAAQISPQCAEAAILWGPTKCASHNEALQSSKYTELFVGALQHWEQRYSELNGAPWQRTEEDIQTLADADHRLDWSIDQREQTLTGVMKEPGYALRFFRGEIGANVKTVQGLIDNKEALETFLAQKRAGLKQLETDMACFKPESHLAKHFAEHREQVQDEIAQFEAFLAALKPLDPKSPDSVFWLKHQWFDCRRTCRTKNAFWPYTGPYGSGRPIQSDLSGERRTWIDPEATQKLVGVPQEGPDWPYNRCSTTAPASEDARVRTLYERGPNDGRALYQNFSLPQAARFSQQVHSIVRRAHTKLHPWQKPKMSHDAKTKTLIHHGIKDLEWGSCGRSGGMIPVPSLPWCTRTHWPTKEQVHDFRMQLAQP
jgi:hypothetical protein